MSGEYDREDTLRVPFAAFPEVHAMYAEFVLTSLIAAASAMQEMRKMRVDAAEQGIDLPRIAALPHLGPIEDANSAVCRLARELMELGYIEGVEAYLAETAV